MRNETFAIAIKAHKMSFNVAQTFAQKENLSLFIIPKRGMRCEKP